MQDPVPADATKEIVVESPGRLFTGKSTPGPEEGLRIPTVFAPFYSGFSFRVVEEAQGDRPPIIVFRNMTFFVPNTTYLELPTSRALDYFELGHVRLCFTDTCAPSPLPLQPCRAGRC